MSTGKSDLITLEGELRRSASFFNTVASWLGMDYDEAPVPVGDLTKAQAIAELTRLTNQEKAHAA